MTADLDLARRLAEHPRFRWEARMAASDDHGLLPDLADPATAGVLLGWLVEWSPSVHHRSREVGGWWWIEVWHPDGRRWEHHGATLGEACARALLACWGEP